MSDVRCQVTGIRFQVSGSDNKKLATEKFKNKAREAGRLLSLNPHIFFLWLSLANFVLQEIENNLYSFNL